MKVYKVLLISMFVSASLIVGMLTLQVQADTITATARCTPPLIPLSGPGPNQFHITLELPKSYQPEDIDPNTISVGEVCPILPKTNWPKTQKESFEFKVDGWCLINGVVKPRICHMAPPPGTKIDIEIPVTGQLYSGSAFQAIFTLTVMTEHKEDHPALP